MTREQRIQYAYFVNIDLTMSEIIRLYDCGLLDYTGYLKMNNFRSLKWCHDNDPECKKFRMFYVSDEIESMKYASNTNFRIIQFKDGSVDVMPVSTKIQIEKR